MIKKIRLDQLKVGMYIQDSNRAWMSHPFPGKRMAVTSDRQLEKLVAAGIRELYIDTVRRLDLTAAPTAGQAHAFGARSTNYIRAQQVDLSRPPGMGRGGRILSHESPAKMARGPGAFHEPALNPTSGHPPGHP
ncbi:MAG TPA: DUF3391 domain-containing protein [Noviherbaspirillum sp.]|uniref:DUF3391 domain-containing protein n=1 Tax=Noviherbaspirillum sp. TaxID=1926288 RepID=UPI002D4DAF8A|nr:DUF3391 domain-containing protein [Noviherbaspirillum sp.]HYD95555.1 DUF3391 domain-containing protein [Noviherbaspirillum sp.]